MVDAAKAPEFGDDLEMIELADVTIQAGAFVTGVVSTATALWALRRWWKRDELFPRISFEVSVNFLGRKDSHIVCELVGKLENKGETPFKFREFTFALRGLDRGEKFEKGGDEIRGQYRIPHILVESAFVPRHWEYSFIYPGVTTEYNFVTAIPDTIEYVRIQADFFYLDRKGESHHAAKVLKVPVFAKSGA